MGNPAPSVHGLLSTLPKRRLVELGRRFGVAIAKPNGVPATESVEQLVKSGQLVFGDLIEWMRRDELRQACRSHGLNGHQRSHAALAEVLRKAHGAETVPPESIFGEVGVGRDAPRDGDVVQVRHRQYLVEKVSPPLSARELTRVDLVCLDDDQQGRPLSVLWELELGARICKPHEGLGTFDRIDPPRHFSAYLHSLKWNAVTATDAALFQAPFRAGIELMNHQLIPLKKALELPRANLFIADDVGLGKTIEAGLVLQELELRQRIQFTLVVCPAALCLQWQREMERRFGQHFEIYDRAFVSRRRRERGYGVNVWASTQRFIVSYQTLRRTEHLHPLIQYLGRRLKKSILVLDEAHTVAPSAPGQYAVDSKLTKLVWQLAPLFENRLFLSATPHNGHSNSFSTLLELLDPQRFTRGVPIQAGSKELREVMVRRLKRDLQEAALGQFPTRHVVRVALTAQGQKLVTQFGDEEPSVVHEFGKPARSEGPSAALAELELSRLLTEYTGLMRPDRGPGKFVFINLQKRLLSSVEAFHRTLLVHVRRLEQRFGASVLKDDFEAPSSDRTPAKAAPANGKRGRNAGCEPTGAAAEEAPCLAEERDTLGGSGEPDQARDTEEDELDREVDAEAERHTAALKAPNRRARALLKTMLDLSSRTRNAPDAKVHALVRWIREHQCPGVGFPEDRRGVVRGGATTAAWQPRRLLVFTEYADTKRYLMQVLAGAIEGTEQAEERLMGFHGAMSDEQRERVQAAFTGDPKKNPVRILVATDAAREGLNLQSHCAHLFHFDIPWNPARLEQRNGRIDRTLQPAKEVFCHYFVYQDRTEDAVLERLVKKVETIRRELGTLGDVVMQRMERTLVDGIDDQAAHALDRVDHFGPQTQTAEQELESQRRTKAELCRETDEAGKIRNRSARDLDFSERHLKDAINVGLELLGRERLRPVASDEDGEVETYELPELPPSWERTLDSLRLPRKKDEPDWEWRKRPVQPVMFRPEKTLGGDRVHLHLEHPFVQRMLSRFLAQGYSAHDLSRVTVVPNDRDGLVRVIVFGRVSLFGPGASRLHDEVISVGAQWLESRGPDHLKPLGDDSDRRAGAILEELLEKGRLPAIPARVQKRVLETAEQDFAALWPAVKAQAEVKAREAVARLKARGDEEARALAGIITAQRQRIQKAQQLSLLPRSLTPTETQQIQEERDHMKQRLVAIQEELRTEPEELRKLYEVSLKRLEPVGMAYLWPTTRLG